MAYWAFFYPSESVVQRVLDGSFVEGAISVNDVIAPQGQTSGPILLSMLVTHPALEGNGEILQLLYSSLVDAIDAQNRAGIRVTSVYSNAYTRKGKNISRSLGMLESVVNKFGNTLFVADWNEVLRKKLVARAERAGRLIQAQASSHDVS